MSLPETQTSVVYTARRQPLTQVDDTPVTPPGPWDVVVRVRWTAASPLDLHRSDGGLYMPPDHTTKTHFGIGGLAGEIVALGTALSSTAETPMPPDSADDEKAVTLREHLQEVVRKQGWKVGDSVAGFPHRGGVAQANFQEYVTAPAWLFFRIPDELQRAEGREEWLRRAATVPPSLLTVFQLALVDWNLPLPALDSLLAGPNPLMSSAAQRQPWILIWGGGSSVGLFAVQVLRWAGYRKILTVASRRHHARLAEYGARQSFDYRDADVQQQIRAYVKAEGEKEEGKGEEGSSSKIEYALDCIGNLEGSLLPLGPLLDEGSRLAVLLPVVVRAASDDTEPELEMDVAKVVPADWTARGIHVQGTRALFFERNIEYQYRLFPEVFPELLRRRIVDPNPYRTIPADSSGPDDKDRLVDRVHEALSLYRRQQVRGEKILVRIP